MLLRPFLNDADFVCQLPVRLHARTPSSRSSTRTPTSSTTTSRRRPRSARRSWPCSRRTCRPTTSPACRRSSSAPARPPTCRPAPASSSSTSRSPTAMSVELGNTLVTAIATPGHAPAHHAYTVADRRRGSEEPWLVFSGDSLLIGDVGRPDLHVAGDARGQARLLHASLRRLLELPDHVVLYPSHYARLGLRPRPLRQPGLLDRLRARPQPAARARRRGRVRRRAARRHAAAAGRAGADRRRQPRRHGGRAAHDAPVRLGLRANARQFALLVGLNALVGGMVGLERSVLPLVGKQDFGLTLDRGDPRLRRRLRRCQGAHEPRRRRTRRAGRAQAAARARLAGRAAGAAADRARALVVVHRRRQPAARRQPGARLVDDGGDEDRPRRAAAARARARAERGGRLPRRRRHRIRSPARSPPATRRGRSSGSARR